MPYSDADLEHMSRCTSQYDSTCRELAAELLKSRKRLKDQQLGSMLEIREAARDARDAAAEAYWQGVQGQDYGSY